MAAKVRRKLRLTVTAWLSSDWGEHGETVELPFGCEDASGRAWTPVLPLGTFGGKGEVLRCQHCGERVRFGWRLGQRGKTAYCKSCVVFENHPRKEAEHGAASGCG